MPHFPISDIDNEFLHDSLRLLGFIKLSGMFPVRRGRAETPPSQEFPFSDIACHPNQSRRSIQAYSLLSLAKLHAGEAKQ